MPDPTPTPTQTDPAPNPDPATPPAGDPSKQDSKSTDPPKGDAPKGDPPKPDEPLGEGGLKALKAEREAREALEKQIKALEPLQKIADALTGGDPAKVNEDPVQLLNERVTGLEESVTTERDGRWRAEVAIEKGLTTDQAARLVGKTKEELAADADKLKELFPASVTPGTPKPDPSQGARGPTDLDAQIAEAEKKGDVLTSIRLKNQRNLAAQNQ